MFYHACIFTAVSLLCSVSHATTIHDGSSYTLLQLLDAADANSPLIKANEADIAHAQASYKQALWAWITPIKITSNIAGPTPEARGDIFNVTPDSIMGTGTLGDWGIMFRWELSGAIPLLTFGKLKHLQAAAKENVAINKAKYNISKNQLFLQIEEAFLAYCLTNQLLELADESITMAQDALNDAIALLDDDDNEQVTQSDIFLLKYLVSELRARRVQAETAHARLAQTIKTLSGLADKNIIIKAIELDEISQHLPTLSALKEWSYVHKPEYQLLQAAQNATKHLLEQKRSSFFPDVFFAGFVSQAYTTSADDQTNPFVRDDYNYLRGGISIGVQYTLNFPTKIFEYRQAKANHNKAIWQKKYASDALQLQLNDFYEQLTSLQQELTFRKQSTKAAKSWVVANMLNFETGLSKAQNLLDAISAYATSKGTQSQMIFNQHVLLAKIRNAVGQHLKQQGPVHLPKKGE